MIKNIISTFFFLFFSILAFGQENEFEFFLETDTSWRKEIFHFPINFASDINYKGIEDARFPVGWEKRDSPNFWSYAFAWNIETEKDISTTDLENDLQKYFNGLMRWKETSVDLSQKDGANNATTYTGTVKTTDAFFTKEPMTLHVKAEKIYCEQKKKSNILFRFSPKEFGHAVWQKLAEVKLPEAMAACEETKVQKIHNLLSLCYDYGKFNGSVLIAEEGKVIYKNGFGLANMEWDTPNKSNTKHRLASISKQFTAMAIVQLVAENKLKLDAPISEYLPDYPKAKGNKITLHHLLTHTSGIPNYTSFPTYWEMMNSPHKPLEIVELFADLDLEFEPGEKFAYSNSGYVLLGVIIEKITGKSYEKVLQEKIFSPLKMNNTGYDNNSTVLKNRASGYNKVANSFENARYINMSSAYAAGALYSTVEDLFLWDQALYTEELLPQKYMDLLFKHHTLAWGGQSYGYGWEVGKMSIGNLGEQIETIGHGGVINGFNTQIKRIPSERSLVVLFNNTGGAPINDISTAIINILNNQSYVLPKKSLAFSLLEEMENENSETAASLFKKLKESSEYHLDEREMNLSGYQLLQAGKTKKATSLFKLIIETFPNSYNAYDSFGEALLVQGDTIQAIENYKKSIQLNPGNDHGMEVLKNLGVETSSLVKKIPVEHLKLLAGEYLAVNQNREWKIIIEEKDGELFGNDGGYRYKLNSVGEDMFINSDDGATVNFNSKDKDAITFKIFGRVNFKKVK